MTLNNKKSANKLLIPAVLILWSIIAFKVISYVKPKETEEKMLNLSGQTIQGTENTDTIIIMADYRDPFKNEYRLTVDPDEKQRQQMAPIKVIQPERPVWPLIEYEGIIINNIKGTRFALLKVNEKTELVVCNDEVNGLKVKSLYSDSVEIEFRNEIKAFKKSTK